MQIFFALKLFLLILIFSNIILYLLLIIIKLKNINKINNFFLKFNINLLAGLLGAIWLNFNVQNFKNSLRNFALLENKPVLLAAKILTVQKLLDQNSWHKLNSIKKDSNNLELELQVVKFIKFLDSSDQSAINLTPKELHAKSFTGKIKVKWYNAPNPTSAKLLPGDLWEFVVKLRRPRNFATRGSFDLERRSFSQRIHMLGAIINHKNNLNSLIQHNKKIYKLARFKLELIEKFFLISKNWNLKNLPTFLAISLGVKELIPDSTKQVFQATGTAHLLTISGLHLGIIASFILLFSNKCWQKFARAYWLQKIPATILGAAVTTVGIWFYASLTGLAVPTTRAAIMYSCYLLGIYFRLNIGFANSYLVAAAGILLLDPLISLNDSFWLSFLAIGILIYSYKFCLLAQPKLHKNFLIKKFLALIKTNWIMFLGFIPINAWFFNKIYCIAYVANLFAVPWISFLILPTILIASLLVTIGNVGLVKYSLIFADHNLAYLLKFLQYLADLKYSSLNLATGEVIVLLLASIGSLSWLLPKIFYPRILLIMCYLPLLCNSDRPKLKPGEAIVSVLDVGQGLAIIVHLANQILLYDVGPANKVVAQYLNSFNYSKIANLIISHTDLDHIGGLEAILANKIKIEQFFTNIENYKVFNLTAKLCTNQSWQIDGVHFSFLNSKQVPSPTQLPELPKLTKFNKNANSCILRMQTLNHTILFPGDLDQKAEQQLLARSLIDPTIILAADLLLIPHHGSASSSSPAFIAAVAPKYAVVSAGFLNPYGHPAPKTLARYLENKITIFNTIVHGTIDLKLSADPSKHGTIESIWYKMTNNKFWNYEF